MQISGVGQNRALVYLRSFCAYPRPLTSVTSADWPAFPGKHREANFVFGGCSQAQTNMDKTIRHGAMIRKLLEENGPWKHYKPYKPYEPFHGRLPLFSYR